MALQDLLPLLFIAITILGAGIQISRKKRSIPASEKIDILLTWAFLVIIGIGGLWAFSGHIFFADMVAASIGWPAGNPFQQEVACANLAIGTLGILSVKISGSFRIATLIAYAIFMIGAGIGHVWQVITAQNFAVNNAGPILLIDICMPPLLIGFYLMSINLKKKESQPSLTR